MSINLRIFAKYFKINNENYGYNMVNIPLFLSIPFILMLLAIAVMPIFEPKFWTPNKNKLIFSILLSIPVVVWFMMMGESRSINENFIHDYVPFITLLGVLFVITGGILIKIGRNATPLTNVLICLVGGVLASFLGTTGAAMLLIRPLIKVNENRKYRVHTILFFIAIVANCGGLITPLGDPPLFMMYLRGVPFTWFASMSLGWGVTLLLLSSIYYIIERHHFVKESDAVKNPETKFSNSIEVKGKLNFLWLAGVIFAVAYFNDNTAWVKSMEPMHGFMREMFLLLMGFFSYFTTKKALHEENKFGWEPILEVAYLFLGIFITMTPCLLYLQHNAAAIGITHPWQFYYITGLLSSFLDNTPTAVTFYSLAQGLDFPSNMQMVAGVPNHIMKAICTASVFFGSMTYIGNGPNFMVKSIAESSGIPMPQFFTYMYKFSLIILLPVFIIVQLLFI